MDFVANFIAGVNFFFRAFGFVLCAGGAFVVLALIASLFGRAFGNLDNGGDK